MEKKQTDSMFWLVATVLVAFALAIVSITIRLYNGVDNNIAPPPANGTYLP